MVKKRKHTSNAVFMLAVFIEQNKPKKLLLTLPSGKKENNVWKVGRRVNLTEVLRYTVQAIRPLAPLVSSPGFQQDTLTTCSRPSSLGQAVSLRHKHLPLLAVVSFRRHTSTFFSSSSLCGFVVSDKSVGELIFAHAQQVNNLV